MPYILHIGSNAESIEKLRVMLPENLLALNATCYIEARGLLDNQESQPSLILVEVHRHSDESALYTEIDEYRRLADVPLLALIDDPAQRQPILEAGVDDYLLLPLIPEEVVARLAHHLKLAELIRGQNEIQSSATQMAFMVLLSRLLSEHFDLHTIFSQTLEQTLNLFSACGGELWLFSNDDEHLDLVSSLFHRPILQKRPDRRIRGQGLIGWAAERDEPLRVESQITATQYDPQVDRPCDCSSTPSMLVVGLRSAGRKIGVLALYRGPAPAFSAPEATLLSEVADLVAAAIAKAQAVQSLRHYAEQQHILYEMSQQISAGLDLHTIVNRTAQWMGRLSEAEFVIIFLVSENQEQLELAGGLGVKLPEKSWSIPIACLPTRSEIICNVSAENNHFANALHQTLGIALRNFLVIPMHHGKQALGMAVLFNRIGEQFSEAELNLLTTAGVMIAISISNARLHTHTLRIIDERERLHQQAIQNERLRTIGRLTASLAHEINNPMQAIRGALALAMEELDSPVDLKDYIRLSQQETDRVVNLVSRMRQLYRPSSDQFEIVNITDLLRETLEIAFDEMQRQRVKVNIKLPPDFLPVSGIQNQLHLAFLSVTLHLIDAIGATGGGQINITGCHNEQGICIEFSTSVSIEPAATLRGSVVSDRQTGGEVGALYGLSLTADIIAANNGSMELCRQDELTIVRVTLPVR